MLSRTAIFLPAAVRLPCQLSLGHLRATLCLSWQDDITGEAPSAQHTHGLSAVEEDEQAAIHEVAAEQFEAISHAHLASDQQYWHHWRDTSDDRSSPMPLLDAGSQYVAETWCGQPLTCTGELPER